MKQKTIAQFPLRLRTRKNYNGTYSGFVTCYENGKYLWSEFVPVKRQTRHAARTDAHYLALELAFEHGARAPWAT